MLGTKCSVCNSQLLSLTGYNQKRKRYKIGDFCPECLVFVNYTSSFNEIRDHMIDENKERKNSKPNFLEKRRKLCPYCLNPEKNKQGKFVIQPKENRFKWTSRKMPKRKNESSRWKCTCQLCGNIWFTNSGDEYYYYTKENKNYQKIGI